MRKRRRPRSTSRGLPVSPLILKIVRVCFVVIFLGLILGIGITVYQLRTISLRHSERVHLVIESNRQEVSLYVVDLVDKKLVAIDVPIDLKIPVVYGYGNYRIAAITELSRQENKQNQLLRLSLAHWLGIDIAHELHLSDSVSNLSSIVAAQGTFSFWERLWLWHVLQTIPQSNRLYTSLSESNLLVEEPDGTSSLATVQLQNFADNYFKRASLYQSSNQLVIVNTTSAPGLATRAANMLKNVGYDVVAIHDNTMDLSQTILLIDSLSEDTSTYIEPLQNLFVDVATQESETLETFRGDVVLLLGDDYARMVRGR